MSQRTPFDDLLGAALISLSGLLLFYVSATLAVSLSGNTGQFRPESALPEFLFRFDGNHYRDIVEKGYDYDPDQRSLVAFFPLYPMAAKALVSTGISGPLSLVAVAQLCQIAGLFAFLRYARRTIPQGEKYAEFACVLVVAFPMHLFWGAAYSEPMFFMLGTLVFLGMRAGLSPWQVACIAGLATSCRSVGVALAPAVLWYAWKTPADNPTGPSRRFLSAAALALLSLSGLLAYMLYQAAAFGEPFAFALTQKHWRAAPEVSMGEKVVSLATLEPIWRALFDSTSPRSIIRIDSSGNPFSNAVLWHILLWPLCGALLIIGFRKREITVPEAIGWLGLWLIPYLTRGHEMAMHSQGRFVSVIAPMYLVLTNRLLAFPEIGRWAIVILFVVVQILLTMQFAVQRAVI